MTRIGSLLRNYHAELRKMHERLYLLNRPWEEAFRHRAGTGPDRELHGHVVAPTRWWTGRPERLGVTSRGWCPALHRDREDDAAGSVAAHGGC